jgi:uncharacterized protein YndB with AHSA1/START domain
MGSTHSTFQIQRHYLVAPPILFHALTDPVAKARWFAGGDGYRVLARSMDVRPGGKEHVEGRWENGTISTFDAIYLDVVPDSRLVYAYEMHIDGRRISVSLATVEIEPSEVGSRFTITEQGAFLDGYDDAGSRESGTRMLLGQLGDALAR